jgi:hypothetical protein
MTELAGVRTITVGGRPKDRPMQTASGSRGTAAYTSNRLDYDIDNLKTLVGNTAALNSLPSAFTQGHWYVHELRFDQRSRSYAPQRLNAIAISLRSIRL